MYIFWESCLPGTKPLQNAVDLDAASRIHSMQHCDSKKLSPARLVADDLSQNVKDLPVMISLTLLPHSRLSQSDGFFLFSGHGNSQRLTSTCWRACTF